ncbi:PREDICTED: leukocyte immunoglobulin-like receptor subfamily A member 6 [Miniopterus natalensis]|uniref:leukocyte immunoglobulin-like receptor subfamily A member 6 n=1 Tax=Miniopterus natalensis TaxID=291302 RepID=UPI0007A71940|nr:PREDICTED: leukocyte immunoglobulin-like receptor subfamily A member 6 [Miniopterus natalensis]
MYEALPILLDLGESGEKPGAGLYLAQGTRAQDGRLPPPVITARPASVVLSKSPVTILCQGPPDAEAYEIFKEKGPEPRNRLEFQVAGKTRTLNFQEMRPDLTGLYSCSYRRGEHQSLLSAPLPLVMTGAYDKPSLSSMNGTVMASGDNVDLECFSKAKFQAFLLTRDDAPHPTQRQSSTPQDNGRQATFHMDHVSPTQAGAYRCYGVFTTDPYLWSHPSDPLELVVTGRLPPPVITARPASVVLSKSPVTILCQGPPDAEAYEIFKEKGPEPRNRLEFQVAGKTRTLNFQEMRPDLTGLYSCSYRRGEHQSLLSAPLPLVMTGRLPPPVITARPASVVLSKSPVTILCQGPPDAEAYEIFKEKGPEPRNRLEFQVAGKTRTLNFQEMRPDLTGLYSCSYRRGEHQSLLSAPLPLVMTGAYDKPSLSSTNGTMVASGDNVDLQCFSKAKFQAFLLTRDDAPHPTQRQSSTPQDNGRQATFHLDHVSPTQAGAYRCYGVFTNEPYLWSHPSDPLELVVTGEGPRPSPASLLKLRMSSPNRAQGHGQWYLLVGLPVAAVLLLLLLLLFLLIKNKAAKTKRQPQASNPMSGRASEARDQQDVTYLQVTFNVPTQGSAATPSSLPREAQTSEYATVAPR